MTATYFQRPLSGQPPAAKKRKGKVTEGQAWGTPSAEELAALLHSIRASLEGPTVRRCEAIALLSDSYAMLLRCQAALPMATETLRGEEVAV